MNFHKPNTSVWSAPRLRSRTWSGTLELDYVLLVTVYPTPGSHFVNFVDCEIHHVIEYSCSLLFSFLYNIPYYRYHLHLVYFQFEAITYLWWTHVCISVTGFLLFLTLNNIPLYRYAIFYLFICWWAFGLLPPLGYCDQSCCVMSVHIALKDLACSSGYVTRSEIAR